jgi:hypothetical protein
MVRPLISLVCSTICFRTERLLAFCPGKGGADLEFRCRDARFGPEIKVGFMGFTGRVYGAHMRGLRGAEG